MFSGFVGGYAKSQSLVANPSTLQNMYTQRMPPGSLTERALYPVPGNQRFGSVAQSGGKRFFSTAATNSRAFSVTGMRLYEWFFDGSSIDRGAVAADANPAVIFTNGSGGQQLGVCAGGNFYVLDLQTNVFTQVVALNGRATQGGFISGYFLVFDINTGTVYQSDLYDGLTFDPANFYQRNVQADDWNAFFVMSWGQIFQPGTKTRDSYYNAGTFPIPFAPAQSGIQTEGIAATFSVAECGKQIAWLGTTAMGGYKVYAAQGYEAVEISTEAICTLLDGMTQLDIIGATGESYADQGHEFFMLTVGDSTLVFDFNEVEWHIRRSFLNATTGELGPWRARWHCFAFNKHLWLDADSSVAYESSIAFLTDVDDLEIQRQRTTTVIFYENQILDIGDIELFPEVGLGNTNDPAMNPVVWLELSFDGAKTFGAQRMASVGREGQYDLRVWWQANGSGRKVVLRVTSTDPALTRWLGMRVDARTEQGQEINLQRAA